MQELAKAAKNPKLLAEAMEMLKDPEIAAEVVDEQWSPSACRCDVSCFPLQVQAMMKDPSFQAEMKQFTESSNFKTAMHRTAEELEVPSTWPVFYVALQFVNIFALFRCAEFEEGPRDDAQAAGGGRQGVVALTQ